MKYRPHLRCAVHIATLLLTSTTSLLILQSPPSLFLLHPLSMLALAVGLIKGLMAMILPASRSLPRSSSSSPSQKETHTGRLSGTSGKEKEKEFVGGGVLVPRAVRVNAHFVWFLVVLGMGVVGTVVMYQVKEGNGKAHYTSWHGFLGVLSVSLALIQGAFGSAVHFYLRTSAWYRPHLRWSFWIHRTFGVFVGLGLATAFYLGTRTSFMQNGLARLGDVSSFVVDLAMVVATVALVVPKLVGA
ncbi:hypothetical protein HK102_004714 [Quaeritorhiza haematococci]|nr:hypothetical protein HK102_004714 [Quaeritorhiza haematococci]